MESLSVELSYECIPAGDCAECKGDAEGLVDITRRRIVLGGSLTAEHTVRLMQIATRCPIDKTLMASSRSSIESSPARKSYAGVDASAASASL